MPRHRLWTAVSVWLLCISSASACLWDSDTLLLERRQFPGAIEMIAGKFLRHSPEFYQWRIRDREAKLKQDPNRLEWYDDLAVAYSKAGDQKKAIEIIEQKHRLKPGLYETEANWGTFLLFDGRWEEALVHVNKALEINPNAHFGREKYQALLIEYVLPRLKDGKPQFPLVSVKIAADADPDHEFIRRHGPNQETFREFLERRLQDRFKAQEAVTAILGMMRFAEYRTPLLLEPLATLVVQQPGMGAQRIASRAYLRAAAAVDDPIGKQAYREMAERILQTQEGVYLPTIETELKRELSEADAWFAELQQAETRWIAEGKDPEAEFERQYPAEPEFAAPMSEHIDLAIGANTSIARILWRMFLAIVTIMIVTVVLILYLNRRRRRAADDSSLTLIVE